MLVHFCLPQSRWANAFVVNAVAERALPADDPAPKATFPRLCYVTMLFISRCLPRSPGKGPRLGSWNRRYVRDHSTCRVGCAMSATGVTPPCVHSTIFQYESLRITFPLRNV